MFGPKEVVFEIPLFFKRYFHDLFGSGSHRQLAHRDHIGAALEQLFRLQPDLPQLLTKVFDDIATDAGSFFDQANQNVFGADIFVIEALGFLIGQLQDLASSFCIFVHASIISIHIAASRKLNHLKFLMDKCIIAFLLVDNAKAEDSWDVIYGTTSAGISAAVQAKRIGKPVVLELKLVLKPGKTIKARLRDQNGDPVDRSDHVGIEPLVTVVSKLRFKSKKRPALVRR